MQFLESANGGSYKFITLHCKQIDMLPEHSSLFVLYGNISP